MDKILDRLESLLWWLCLPGTVAGAIYNRIRFGFWSTHVFRHKC